MKFRMRDRMTFSEIMAFNAPYNQRNIDELINKIKTNTVVPYVGAGMSVLFDNIYPSWTKFLYDAFGEFADVKEKDKFEKLNHEEKADFLYKEIGKRTFSTYLKEIFGPAHLEKDASCFSNKPAFLLPVIFNKGLLMTTNYDKVIEKNYALFQKAVPVAHPGHFEALNGALRNEELLLYKIHGDISEPIESIILTKEQYEKAYGNQSLKEALTKIYISKNILFLGCGLCKDRPIQFLLEVSQSGMDNFAIVSCAGEQVKQRRLELENEYYTKAIIYPEAQHECLFEILKYIAQAVNPEEYNATNGYQQIENNLELDDEWFIKQNEIQIKNLGDRYLPDLNVEPNVSKVFDGLSRNDTFYERLKKQTDNLLICLNELKMSVIEENILQLANAIEGFSINTNDLIDVDNIKENLNVVYSEIEKK